MPLSDPPFDADEFPEQAPLPFPCTECGACDDRTRIGGLLCIDCFCPLPGRTL